MRVVRSSRRIVAIVAFGLALSFAPNLIGSFGSSDLSSDVRKVIKDQPQTVRDVTLINQDGQPTKYSDLRGQQGRWRVAYDFQTPPDVIARDIQVLLKES